MIHTGLTVRTLQAVAMSVALAVFLWSTGLPTLFHTVEAASISSASDTLSVSAPLTGSVHTIAFTLPSGMSIGETFEVTFDGAFDSTSTQLNITDVTITVGGDATTTASSSGAGAWGVSGWGTDTMTFETPTDYGVASSGALVLTLGTDGVNTLINPPDTGSYAISIGGGGSTMQDTGEVRVAIIDEVTVSASVDTSLTFTVSGVGSGATVNGSPTTTAAASTVTTLPFGSVTIGTSKVLAQRLNVATNATNGYTVTVEQTGALQSTTGATIDSFVDGTETTVPTPWVGPSADIADDKSYGHWGITSTDGTTTRASQFDSDLWVGGSTSTPVIIMGHTGASDGLTEGVGSTTVGYQIEISALQEAGGDYSTTLRYIATPTF